MEQFTLDLAASMISHFDVTIVTTPVPGHGKTFILAGVQVVTVTRCKPGRYSLVWWLSVALTRGIRECDIVFSVSAGATPLILFRRRVKTVFQAHGSSLSELLANARLRPRLWVAKVARSAWWMLVDQLTYLRADVVVAASPHVAMQLKRATLNATWRHTPLRTISNTVDGDLFAFDASARREVRAQYGFSPDDVVAVYVGRLDFQKGVDRLLAALECAARSMKIIILGDGPELPTLKMLAALQGDDRVTFAGKLSRERVAAILSAADVFVFPVRAGEREGLPLAVLEALAAGLPVVAAEETVWPRELNPFVQKARCESPSGLQEAILEASGLPRRTAPLDTSSAWAEYSTLLADLVGPSEREERRH